MKLRTWNIGLVMLVAILAFATPANALKAPTNCTDEGVKPDADSPDGPYRYWYATSCTVSAHGVGCTWGGQGTYGGSGGSSSSLSGPACLVPIPPIAGCELTEVLPYDPNTC